jgi:hypothetical protein
VEELMRVLILSWAVKLARMKDSAGAAVIAS